MLIKEYISRLDENQCKEVLFQILDRYLEPAFGSLTKKEADLVMIDALEDVRYISYAPTVYEMERKLRITRRKARSLIYENDLRHTTSEDLDRRARDVLKKPIIQKDGEFFWLRAENPLVEDHLRSVIDTLGAVADASFEPGLIKLSVETIAGLLEHYLTDEEREEIKDVLQTAGVLSDRSLQRVIVEILKTLAHKYAQDAGEELVEHAVGYMSPAISGAIGYMTDSFKAVVSHAKSMFIKELEGV